MATELDHTFSTDKSAGDAYESILDLERLVPAVEGGSVTGKESDDKVNAEIVMRMGAMSMKLIGTVEVVEKDDAGRETEITVIAGGFGVVVPPRPPPRSPSRHPPPPHRRHSPGSAPARRSRSPSPGKRRRHCR